MFWENFVILCNKNNTKPNPVAKELGLSSGSVTKWKNGAEPNATTIQRIADYFGVTVDYLLSDKKNAPTPTRSECEEKILEHFRGLSSEEQDAFLKVIEAMSKSNGKPQ